MMRSILMLAMAGVLFAHEEKGGKKIEITGTVVDVACYVGHGSTGTGHASCAEACAKAGNPLAILDAKTKLLYLPISMDHKSPNAKLMGFIEKKVKVTGVLIEKAGVRGIAVQKVEAAE